jgi:hypothetical protein
MVTSTHRPPAHTGRTVRSSRVGAGAPMASTKPLPRRVAPLLVGLLLLAPLAGCYWDEEPGPATAPTVTPPRNVTVTIEYRQPAGCVNVASPCDEAVVFFASWMKLDAYIILQPDPGRYVWRGIAYNVPVNYPPRDYPYLVRIFDPHLRETVTNGITGERLKVGGEALVHFDSPGTPKESALVFIDENGAGHNPFY